MKISISLYTTISKEWAWNLPTNHPCFTTTDNNTGQEEEVVVGCTKLTRRPRELNGSLASLWPTSFGLSTYLGFGLYPLFFLFRFSRCFFLVKFGKVSSSLSWNTKKLCKALVDAPINFLKIAQNELKNEKDMGLKLTRGLELFFQKNWSKLLIIIFMCFLGCSFIYDVQRIVVALQFPCPMT